MTESSDLTAAPIVSPLEALAAELGADVARIEREIKLTVALEIERLRAETATQMLALHDRIEAKAAALRAVPPPAEPEEPDDIAPMVAKALALIAEVPAAPPQPPAVVNVTVPLPAPRTERTRVTKHDEQGRIVEIERDVA
jgi:hypothetical protein